MISKAMGGLAAAVAMLAALTIAGEAAEKRRVLLLDLQFDSSATEGQSKSMEAEDRTRLAKVEERLTERFRASDAYEVVEAPEISKEIASFNLGACGRCELMLGKKAGADFVMVGSVQKLSAMLMNVQVIVYSVADGGAVAAGAGVIHSNTDADWMRAIDRIAGQKLGLPRTVTRQGIRKTTASRAATSGMPMKIAALTSMKRTIRAPSSPGAGTGQPRMSMA